VRGVNAVPEDINLASLIDDVVVMLRIITSRQIHFADARYYMISGDRNLLIQAFNNIIWNAVEATNESGEVRITIEAQEQEWLVRVVDNGKGIAQEDIAHIFKPFFSRKANGTGLGLAIARKNIIANDGHIECESGDKGTEFRVYLPMGNI
jgi:signal transduction histidine kinase